MGNEKKFYIEVQSWPPKFIVHKVEDETSVVEYENLRKMIATLKVPFDWFEIVRNWEDRSYMVIVDEEGLIKNTHFNAIASHFYNDNALFGDAIILGDKGTPEIYYLDEAQTMKMSLEAMEYVREIMGDLLEGVFDISALKR